MTKVKSDWIRLRCVASLPEKSLYDEIVEELKKGTREDLLPVFRREVLNYDMDEFLTKEEQLRLAEYGDRWFADKAAEDLTKEEKDRLAVYFGRWLAGKAREEEAKRRAKDLGVPYIRVTGGRSRKEAAFLLRKGESAKEMRRLSDCWKRRVESDFGTTQGITDEELIDAIAQMRLLRKVEQPFDYERYMKHLFKGRQKGRAYKAFLER